MYRCIRIDVDSMRSFLPALVRTRSTMLYEDAHFPDRPLSMGCMGLAPTAVVAQKTKSPFGSINARGKARLRPWTVWLS